VNGLDLAVFRAINGLPDGLAPFFVFLSNATKLTVGIALLVAIFIALVVFKPTRKAAILAMPSWLLANATTDVLKDLWPVIRPSSPQMILAHPEFHQWVKPLDSPGTASAHAANMMAVAVAFLWLYRPVGWCWLVVAILTGVSRVYVGVHWPSQVVLGWLCGAVAGTVVVKSWEAAVSLRQRETSEDPSSRPEES